MSCSSENPLPFFVFLGTDVTCGVAVCFFSGFGANVRVGPSLRVTSILAGTL